MYREGRVCTRDERTVKFCNPESWFFKTQPKSNNSPKLFSNVKSKSKWSPNDLKNAAFSQKNAASLFHLLSLNAVRFLNFEEIYSPKCNKICYSPDPVQSKSSPKLMVCIWKGEGYYRKNRHYKQNCRNMKHTYEFRINLNFDKRTRHYCISFQMKKLKGTSNFQRFLLGVLDRSHLWTWIKYVSWCVSYN